MPTPDAALYTTSPSMGITIADNTSTVANGQPVHSRVTIHNPLSTITVRVTFSSSTSFSASSAAFSAFSASAVSFASITGATAVAWKNTLSAGSPLTYTAVSGPDLAATACPRLTPDSPALTCATALDTITTPRERSLAWLASLILGLLAVAGSIWLHRRITPDLLTPANASHDHPEQP